jgi:hypothetical protein
VAERQVHPSKSGGAGAAGGAVRTARTNARAVPPPANDNRFGRRGLVLIAALLAALLALAFFLNHAAS